MDTLWQDIRYATRLLTKNPGFAAVALLTLALGIGANTAIFSVVHGILFQALPWRDAGSLVMIWEQMPARNNTENVTSPANYLSWREQNTVFEELSAMYSTGATLNAGQGAERIQAAAVTDGFFRVLGADARLGRVFTAEEARDGDDVIVLSHGFWQQRFGGNASVVGKTIDLNGSEQVIVGVMPPTFSGLTFRPVAAAFRNDWMTEQKLWAPMSLGDDARQRFGRYLTVVGRLQPGVTVDDARAEMKTIAARLEDAHEFNEGATATVVSLRDQVVGNARPALVMLLAAVGVVLLIACSNVAHLLLARATGRQREMAVRGALGAGRARVLRQLLTESLMLASAGTALGLVLAYWGVEAVRVLGPRDIPRLDSVTISVPVLAFAAGLAVLSSLISGLVPALQVSRPDLHDGLKEGGRGSMGRSGRRTHRILVVAETALAAVLLISAGLLLRSFQELRAVDPGFDAEHVISAKLNLAGSEQAGDEVRAGFVSDLLGDIRALPGVTAASVTVARPLGGGLAPATSFWPTDRDVPPPGERTICDVRMVAPDYFETMQIPLLAGRDFDARDHADAPNVLIVNRALAEQIWPDDEPVGKQLVVRMEDEEPRTVVGVVGDVRHSSLDSVPQPKVYYAHAQFSWNFMDLVVRGTEEPASLVPALRRTVRQANASLPLYEIRAMRDVVSDSTATERFNTLLLACFALISLVLAAIGIYGVLATNVSRRRREIGIRVALGADRGRVIGLVVREGLLLTFIGLGIGSLAALAAARLMSSLLYGVSSLDPLTFASAPALLAATALAASYLPARRAARVDPIRALHDE